MQVQAQTVQPRLEQRTTKSEEVQKQKPQTQANQTQGNEKENDTAKTSAYAKVLSRIENIQGDPALKEKAVDIFSGAIERRLKEVTDQERKEILELDATKTLEIEKVEDFAAKIKEGLLNDENQEATLALLKNSKFMEFMQDKPKNDAKTYSPQTGDVAKEKSSTTSSTETDKQAQTPDSVAMQKIKTAQAASAIKTANSPEPTRHAVA